MINDPFPPSPRINHLNMKAEQKKCKLSFQEDDWIQKNLIWILWILTWKFKSVKRNHKNKAQSIEMKFCFPTYLELSCSNFRQLHLSILARFFCHEGQTFSSLLLSSTVFLFRWWTPFFSRHETISLTSWVFGFLANIFSLIHCFFASTPLSIQIIWNFQPSD